MQANKARRFGRLSLNQRKNEQMEVYYCFLRAIQHHRCSESINKLDQTFCSGVLAAVLIAIGYVSIICKSVYCQTAH